jgi:hypothetical protein
VLNRKRPRSRPPNRKPAPSRKTKKKIPNTKRMALTPQRRIPSSIKGSVRTSSRRQADIYCDALSFGSGTYPLVATIFWPASECIQSR